METLSESQMPSVETLARIIAAVSESAADAISRAESVEVRVPINAQTAAEITGWASERRGKVIVATVEYTRYSVYFGREVRRGATVIQVSEGGRAGGEGWAEVSQYVLTQPVNEEQAESLAALVSIGAVPKLAARREL